MKKALIILGFVAGSTLYIGGVHSAEPSYYIGASAGVSETDRDFGFSNPRITTRISAVETDRVPVGTFKVGKYLTNNLRAEIEYGYLDASEYTAFFNPFPTTEQRVKTRSNRLMLNVAYDFKVAGAIKLFPMAGIGIARNTSDGFQTSAAGAVSDFATNSSTNFAWLAGVGISYELSNTLVLDLTYQHLNMGDANTGISQFGLEDEQFTGILSSNEFKVGIRYKF